MRVLALLLLLPAATAAQSAAASQYNQGNAFYQQGRFEEARDRYLLVADRGVVDSRLFYNLGNACFKAGRLGEAILWYERALRLAPRDEDIRANLRFANLLKQDRGPEEDNAVWRFLGNVFTWPTLDELCVAFSILLLLVFALAVRQLRSRTPASTGRLVLILACIGLTALDALYLGARVYHRESVVAAIVIAAQATARSGPGEDETPVFVVHEGTKVRVSRREGDWLLVKLANGLGGWLPSRIVEVI